jgi:hypothetical protein
VNARANTASPHSAVQRSSGVATRPPIRGAPRAMGSEASTGREGIANPRLPCQPCVVGHDLTRRRGPRPV